LKVEEQPEELQQQLEKIVLEANDARDVMHKKTAECTTILKEVNDWMGVINRRNQALEDLQKKSKPSTKKLPKHRILWNNKNNLMKPI
jgi:hypothetical protein